jgi:Isopentenyldiphosphate isomerase
MEKWDLYDERRKLLKKIHIRGDKFNEGEFHIVVETWTINSKNEILLTLRDPSKEDYPNYWENTAGSVLAGEASKQGAKRELIEETGININEEELLLLNTYKGSEAFVDQYMIRKDIKINELVLQKGETVDAKWVSLSEFDKMIEKGEIALSVVERLIPMRKAFEKFIYKN